jgi:gamma-glutamyltranspeptidase/glutathione hydrolase
MAVQAPSFRPTVAANHYAVATGHYLATATAMRMLDCGGNAVDAGVTAAMALPMLQPAMVIKVFRLRSPTLLPAA